MLNASPRFRYYLALCLLLLLGTLLQLSAQPRPSGLAGRATAYTRYLTQALRLQPHQYTPVQRCTQRQLASLDSLAAQPAATRADYAHAEARYAAAVLPVLTAGQYNAFVRLREQQPADPTAAPYAGLR